MFKYKFLTYFVLSFFGVTLARAQDGLFSPSEMREDFRLIRNQLF